jgi:hypothetical protein
MRLNCRENDSRTGIVASSQRAFAENNDAIYCCSLSRIPRKTCAHAVEFF